MFKNFLILLALLFIATPAQAEKACTEMWCQEGLMLQLKGIDWPAGDYQFTVDMDGARTVCKGSLPFKTCDGSVTCDTTDITIGESGCALPEGHTFHAILSPKTPKHLTVSITRGDGKSFAYDSVVNQQCGFPNGAECDKRQCCSAVIDAQVDWK